MPCRRLLFQPPQYYFTLGWHVEMFTQPLRDVGKRGAGGAYGVAHAQCGAGSKRCCDAAIDIQDVAIDEIRCRAGKEHRWSDQILDIAPAP